MRYQPWRVAAIRTGDRMTTPEAAVPAETSSDERWLPVVGYEGLYEVSDHGQVRSIAFRNNVVGYRPRIKMLRNQLSQRGYYQVGLSKNSEIRHKMNHVLVLEAFVGPRPPKLVSAHYDGNKINNRLPNLRWATQRENLVLDQRRLGIPENSRCELCNNFIVVGEPCSRCVRVAKPLCVNGHPWSKYRGIKKNGNRRCRQCDRNRDIKHRASLSRAEKRQKWEARREHANKYQRQKRLEARLLLSRAPGGGA